MHVQRVEVVVMWLEPATVLESVDVVYVAETVLRAGIPDAWCQMVGAWTWTCECDVGGLDSSLVNEKVIMGEGWEGKGNQCLRGRACDNHHTDKHMTTPSAEPLNYIP